VTIEALVFANFDEVTGEPTILKADRATPAASLGGGSVAWGAVTGALGDQTDLNTALVARDTAIALKAPLASPALTGTPTAPTPAPGDNTTKISTTAFVQAAVAALVASSPAALDTLKELADAIGDDANFAATMTNALALKAPLASPALTGTPTAPTAAVDTNTTQLATMAAVIAQLFRMGAPTTLASAATVNIGAATPWVELTGTTTVTAFDTVPQGVVRLTRSTTGTISFTHNATSLISVYGANTRLLQGEWALWISLGSGNWAMLFTNARTQSNTSYLLFENPGGGYWRFFNSSLSCEDHVGDPDMLHQCTANGITTARTNVGFYAQNTQTSTEATYLGAGYSTSAMAYLKAGIENWTAAHVKNEIKWEVATTNTKSTSTRWGTGVPVAEKSVISWLDAEMYVAALNSGYANYAMRFSYADNAVAFGASVSDLSKVKVTVGATQTVPNNISTYIVKGAIAAATVTLPATPKDGQLLTITFSGAVTALTVDGNGKTINPTMPASTAAGTVIALIYDLADTTWYGA